MESKTPFKNVVLDALLQILNAIIYILRLPFDLWFKALTRLSEQKKDGVLKMNGITGPWPFISFAKRFCFEFLIDAITVLSYPLMTLKAIYHFFDNLITPISNDFFSFEVFKIAILEFIASLIAIYLFPFVMAAIRDFLQMFIILPIRKLLSWLRKPAQQLDIDLKNK